MSDILQEIVANKRREVETAKQTQPLSALKAFAEAAEPPRDFLGELVTGAAVRVIAECKQRSPSRGVICENYDPVALAASYARAGAKAVSVLTDQSYFGGQLEHLQNVHSAVSLPVMRKDFIIDEYQIYEARRYDADSFLLLSGVLDQAQLQYFIEIGRELEMEPLVESHSREDLETALSTDAKILGVNNRDLSTMKVSLAHSIDLVSEYSEQLRQRVLVCESGIKTPEDVSQAKASGFHAFLVGTALASAPDPEKALRELIG